MATNVSLILKHSLLKVVSPQINNPIQNDLNTNSILNANLTSSNLFFNESTGKVEYILAPEGDQTPIGFGSDGNDAGAWNSGIVLSTNDEDLLKQTIKIHYNPSDKTITLFNNSNESMNVEIFNLLGVRLLFNANLSSNTKIDASNFKTGIYILRTKSANKSFSVKLIVF
jgi:hypothetical protein